MTQTSEYSIEQVAPVRKLVAKGGFTLASVVKVASGVLKPLAQRVVDRKVTLPAKIRVTDIEHEALMSLRTDILSAQWPTSRRLLTVPERCDLLTLLRTAKIVKGLIERVEASLKPAFFNHLDIVAEANEGVIDDTVEIDKYGFYVLPGQVGHAEVDIVASREPRAGSTTLTDEGLRALEDRGLIDHETYLRWTKPERVPDEFAILADIAEKPWAAMVIAQATERGAASTALQKRAAK